MATTVRAAPESRFLLSGVSWEFYEACLAAIGDRRIRVSYYRGNIEMMTVSREHERCKSSLRRMIDAVTEELRIPIQSLGSMTWRKRELEAGLEPDECYYIEHEPQIRSKEEIELAIDPPPDLAVEVEISRSAIDRMAIYAALGVPEVWRYNGTTLTIDELGEDGQYHERARSRNLPFLPPKEIARFLAARNDTDETTWIRSFRQWVRENVLPTCEDA